MTSSKQILTLALTAALLTPLFGGPARADHDRGRIVNRHQSPGARRAERSLLRQATDLRSDIVLAARRRDLGRRAADDLLYRLDRVVRFLQHDRYLSPAEFDRRERDIHHIAADFSHRARGRGHGRRRVGRLDVRHRDGRRGSRTRVRVGVRF